jgi:hypothetical protein
VEGMVLRADQVGAVDVRRRAHPLRDGSEQGGIEREYA